MSKEILYDGLTRFEIEQKCAEYEYERLSNGDVIDILINGCVGYCNFTDGELIENYIDFFEEE